MLFTTLSSLFGMENKFNCFGIKVSSPLLYKDGTSKIVWSIKHYTVEGDVLCEETYAVSNNKNHYSGDRSGKDYDGYYSIDIKKHFLNKEEAKKAYLYAYNYLLKKQQINIIESFIFKQYPQIQDPKHSFKVQLCNLSRLKKVKQ